jgi:hypothetical protein
MNKELKKYEKMAVEIFLTQDQDIAPLIEMGMNKTSAKDTMKCYSLLFKGEPFRRGIQQNVIKALLQNLYNNNGKENLANVLIGLDKHFEIRLKKYEEKNIGAREIAN